MNLACTPKKSILIVLLVFECTRIETQQWSRVPCTHLFSQVTLFYHYMEGIHSEFTEEKPKV